MRGRRLLNDFFVKRYRYFYYDLTYAFLPEHIRIYCKIIYPCNYAYNYENWVARFSHKIVQFSVELFVQCNFLQQLREQIVSYLIFYISL